MSEELERAYVRIDERCATCDLPFSQDNCDPCAWDERALDAVIRALL